MVGTAGAVFCCSVVFVAQFLHAYYQSQLARRIRCDVEAEQCPVRMQFQLQEEENRDSCRQER